MISGLSIYLVNFIQLGLLCLVFILVGRQFAKHKKITFREIFFSLFLGTIALSTLFAIIYTKGTTIMLGFVLLAIFYIIQKQNLPATPQPYNGGNPGALVIPALLFGAVFVYSWSFFTLVQFDSFPYHLPAGTAMAPNDYLINVWRSYYLGETGEENYYHFYNTVDPAYHGPKPYHYLEMWTTVALTTIFRGLTAEKFVLLTIPLYHFIAFTGMLALWERYQTVKWYHLVLTALFFFLAGIYIPMYYQLGILDFSLPIFTHRIKMCVYYPFIFAFFLTFDKERPQLSVIMLSGLLLATVVVAPAILGGVLLFSSYQFLRTDNKRNALESAGILLAVAGFIFLFYKLLETGQFNIRANAGSGSLTAGLLAMLLDAPFQKILLTVQHLCKEALLYLPLWLLGLFLVWKERSIFTRNASLLLLVCSILISGAGAFALFEGEKDATQLFFNIGNALLNCCLIWAVIRCFSLDRNQQTKQYLGVGLLLLLIFFKQIPQALQKNVYPAATTPYSNDYLTQIKTFIVADNDPTIGAAIKGGRDYRSAFSKQTAAYTLGYYLAYMENGAIALQVSDFDIPNPSTRDRQARASNLFYRFVEQQKENQTFVSLGNAQAAFINQYELDFVVVSKNGLLRPEVNGLVKNAILDPVSGERFLILK